MASHDLVNQKDYEENKDKLLNIWLKEIQENPHFTYDSVDNIDKVSYLAKDILDIIFKSFNLNIIPDFSSEKIQPLLKVWHALMQDQRTKGVSTKDTAMFIFSLKSALTHAQNNLVSEEQLKKINQLLDFIGLLTFETYSNENKQILERQKEQIHYLQECTLPYKDQKLIGSSPEMMAVYRAVGLVLENDVTVLLEGDTGTGKELIASLIHYNSKRKDKPYITLNCGAIPKELVESELFGHEKGSFTGAFEKKIGKFELAQDGTLFLDEIGELPLDMQVKLLRVLQNKEIERIGGTTKIKVNVRIIAATNKNLKEEVDHKRFRSDLYYRINVFPIRIPPLSERKSDIILLAQYFIEKYNLQFGAKITGISEQALKYLEALPWEGNVRELENIIQRAVLLSPSPVISLDIVKKSPAELGQLLLGTSLPKEEEKLLLSGSSKQIIPLDVLEKEALQSALALKKGNIFQAAKELGISRTTFYNKAKRYKLNIEEK